MIPIYAEPLPCAGHKYDYDALIDGGKVATRATVAYCRAICATCPIRADCWTDNADEDWVKRLRDAPQVKPCERCGTAMELRLRGAARRFCSRKCQQATKDEEQAA